jgi:hypothetical protein
LCNAKFWDPWLHYNLVYDTLDYSENEGLIPHSIMFRKSSKFYASKIPNKIPNFQHQGINLIDGRDLKVLTSDGHITRNKTIHQGFRIQEETLRRLDIQAEKRGITLSSLVNRILRNYVTRDMYFEELNFILIGKDMLRTIFEKTESMLFIEEAKELGAKAAKSYIPFFFTHINCDTLIKFLELWFSRFGTYQYRVEDHRHHFYLYHDINMNYTIFCKEYLSALIEPIVPGSPVFNMLSPNAFSFWLSI